MQNELPIAVTGNWTFTGSFLFAMSQRLFKLKPCGFLEAWFFYCVGSNRFATTLGDLPSLLKSNSTDIVRKGGDISMEAVKAWFVH